MKLPNRRLLWTLTLAGLAGLLGWGGLWAWQRSAWAAQRRLDAVTQNLKRWHLNQAAKDLESCRAAWAQLPAVYLLSARAQRLLENFSPAEEFLREFLQHGGAEEDHRRESAMLSAYRGHVDPVEAFLQQSLVEEPADDVFLFDALVMGYRKAHRLPEAEHWLARWRRRYPEAVPALLHQAALLERALRGEEAALVFQRILRLDADNDVARLRLAQNLVTRNQPDQALEHLLQLQTRLPDDRQVLQELARCWQAQGDVRQAKATLDRLVEQYPDDGAVVGQAALFAMSQASWDSAERLLRRAHALKPFEPMYAGQLHQCLTILGKDAEAKQFFEKSKQLQADYDRVQLLVTQELPAAPRNFRLRHEAGAILMRHGEYEQAIRWFHSALRENAHHQPSRLALAECYEKTGRPELAEEQRRLAASGPGSAAPR